MPRQLYTQPSPQSGVASVIAGGTQALRLSASRIGQAFEVEPTAPRDQPLLAHAVNASAPNMQMGGKSVATSQLVHVAPMMSMGPPHAQQKPYSPIGAQQAAPPPDLGWAPSQAPVLCDMNNANGASFPLQNMKVSLDVHMASMFVKMEGTWTVQVSTGGLTTTALLKIPTSQKATITACAVTIGTRIFRTAVIDNDESAKLATKGSSFMSGPANPNMDKIDECVPSPV
jgi:hypothetical protein